MFRRFCKNLIGVIILMVTAAVLTAAVPVSEVSETSETSENSEGAYLPTLTTLNSDDMPYFAKSLTAEELSAFVAVRAAARMGINSVTIYSPLTEELWAVIIELTDNQDPLCFNLKTVRPEIGDGQFTLEFTYFYSKASYEKAVTAANEAANGILAQFTPEMSEVKKIQLIYNALRSAAIYDESAPYADNFYGVFKAGAAGQEGFAEAFSYVCTKAGIENVIKRGTYSDGAVLIVNRVTLENGKTYNVCVPAEDFFMKNDTFLEEALQ
jgi:hypothetical protein